MHSAGGMNLDPERPDVFGKYNGVMIRIHTPLMEALVNSGIVTREAAKLRILQQHMTEYIQDPHDYGYTYYNYSAVPNVLPIVEASSQVHMSVVVNEVFMDTLPGKGILSVIVDGLLVETWAKVGDLRLTLVSKSQGPAVAWDDVIQSVHFLGHKPQPPIDQFLKILYPFRVFERSLSIALSRL